MTFRLKAYSNLPRKVKLSQRYEMNEFDFIDVWKELSCIPADPPVKRELCLKCRRPVTVCWCPFLPREPVDIMSNIIVLQHPGEEKRCLRTAPMLEMALPSGHFQLFKGRRFSSQVSTKLKSLLTSPDTILFYPGCNAVSLESLPTVDETQSAFNIVIIDGTWPQARSIYANSEEIRNLKQVQINSKGSSEYVIRTQPTEKALSTVETAAIALAALEAKPHLKEVLVKPLKALCGFQLAHGAVTHQSKEFLLRNGLYKKLHRNFHLPQQEYLL